MDGCVRNALSSRAEMDSVSSQSALPPTWSDTCPSRPYRWHTARTNASAGLPSSLSLRWLPARWGKAWSGWPSAAPMCSDMCLTYSAGAGVGAGR